MFCTSKVNELYFRSVGYKHLKYLLAVEGKRLLYVNCECIHKNLYVEVYNPHGRNEFLPQILNFSIKHLKPTWNERMDRWLFEPIHISIGFNLGNLIVSCCGVRQNSNFLRALVRLASHSQQKKERNILSYYRLQCWEDSCHISSLSGLICNKENLPGQHLCI